MNEAGASMLEQGVMRGQDPAMEDSGDDVPEFRHHLLLLPRNNSGSSLVDALESSQVSSDHDHDKANTEGALPRSWMKSGRDDVVYQESASGDEAHAAGSVASEPTVCTVLQSFDTLSKALESAQDGARLLLPPGVYTIHAPIEVTADNLSVCADPSDSRNQVEIQLQGPGASLIVSGIGVQFCGLVFAQRAFNSSTSSTRYHLLEKGVLPASINVIAGDARFYKCSFTSSLSHGICIWNSASPYFQSCSIDKCVEPAVVCRNSCSPTFKGNTFGKNHSFAIVIMDATSGTFESNSVSRNEKCAIICGGSSTTCFERNVVSDSLQGQLFSP